MEFTDILHELPRHASFFTSVQTVVRPCSRQPLPASVFDLCHVSIPSWRVTSGVHNLSRNDNGGPSNVNEVRATASKAP